MEKEKPRLIDGKKRPMMMPASMYAAMRKDIEAEGILQISDSFISDSFREETRKLAWKKVTRMYTYIFWNLFDWARSWERWDSIENKDAWIKEWALKGTRDDMARNIAFYSTRMLSKDVEDHMCDTLNDLIHQIKVAHGSPISYSSVSNATSNTEAEREMKEVIG